MEVTEKWGHRADALVACLMAFCALAVAIYGITYTCQSFLVRPYLLVFVSLQLLWFGWIFHSLVMRAQRGHFAPAAWHVAIALPMATLCLLSVMVCSPQHEKTYFSPVLSERLLEQILLSLRWWMGLC